MSRPFALILIALVAAIGAPRGAAGDDSDHDLARRLLEQGRILPLAEIVDKVRSEIPGEMLEVEFETDDGAHIYELKILRPDGRVQEIEVEAATGKIVKIEDDD
jgi:uncharacterized membrane protein YkoI